MLTARVPTIWKRPLLALAVTLLLAIVAYFDTFREIVDTWGRSGTFTHGYLIVPIVVWLIWEKRFELALLRPVSNYWAVPVLFLLGLMWLLGYYAGIWVIQQFAVVGMIPVIVLGLMGWAVVRTILFPLCFLGFMVPLGEELVPTLINFTADFTTAMIRLTGIPIYREGTYFELPTGNWSVVKACSGVRYLISSIALGLLYAYLSYRSLSKRLIFFIVAIIVPIFANGLRAFMIVMIGHFSGMALATGVDHLVYGWLFFGLVIGIMFYIGSFWYDEPIAENITGEQIKEPVPQASTENSQLGWGTALVLLALLFWPFKAWLGAIDVPINQSYTIPVPTPSASWSRGLNALTDWNPVFHGLDAELDVSYVSGKSRVAVYIGAYQAQRQGAELINSQNRLIIEYDSPWRLLESKSLQMDLPGQSLVTPAAILTSSRQKLLAVHFYYVGGELTTSRYKAKLLEVKSKLFSGNQRAAIVSYAAELGEDEQVARDTLQRFAERMTPAILNTLENIQTTQQ